MKASKFSFTILLAGTLTVVFLGCSSGGSDGSTGESVDVELTKAAAEKLAVSAATAMPGCVYTSDSIAAAPEFQIIDTLYKSSAREIADNERAVTYKATSIDERHDGNCPTDPGYYTKVGTHDNGVDDLTYTYYAYCNGDGTDSTTITGVSHVKNVGTPDPLGPIPQYISVKSGDMTIIEKSDEGTFTHTVKGSNVKYTFGNGEDDPTEAKPNVFEVDSWSIVDGREGKTYKVDDVKITTYESGEDVVTVINNLVYTDPETGTVKITTTPLVSEDGSITSGTITVNGTDGTSMTMAPEASVTNGFGVIFDSETIGVIDCSGINAEE